MSRVLIILFGVAIVAIAARDIHSRIPKKDREEIQKSADQLLAELRGDIDIAKASVSAEYLRSVAGKPSVEEEQQQAEAAPQSPGIVSSAAQKLKETLSRLAK